MTSEEKFDLLMSLQRKKSRVKITSVRGEEFVCRLRAPAEDEEDWAYGIITFEEPPQHFILECNYIAKIEELVDD